MWCYPIKISVKKDTSEEIVGEIVAETTEEDDNDTEKNALQNNAKVPVNPNDSMETDMAESEDESDTANVKDWSLILAFYYLQNKNFYFFLLFHLFLPKENKYYVLKLKCFQQVHAV